MQIESLLKEVPGATDIVADRIVGKPYLEFHIDRDRIARYGVSIRDVQDVIEVAIGGMNFMESVEGREPYPIRVRYLHEFHEDIPELGKILVPTSTGAQIPLAQVITSKSVLGPQEIKGERGLLVGYVTMNTRDRDEVSGVRPSNHVDLISEDDFVRISFQRLCHRCPVLWARARSRRMCPAMVNPHDIPGPQSRFLTSSLHPASVTPLPSGRPAAAYAA